MLPLSYIAVEHHFAGAAYCDLFFRFTGDKNSASVTADRSFFSEAEASVSAGGKGGGGKGRCFRPRTACAVFEKADIQGAFVRKFCKNQISLFSEKGMP